MAAIDIDKQATASSGYGPYTIDFSSAGYRSGAKPPRIEEVGSTLHPVAGSDQTIEIQAAIDAAEKSHRPGVLLSRGTYRISKALKISSAGIVLRGEPGTKIVNTNKNSEALIIGSKKKALEFENPKQYISGPRVALGQKEFKVDVASAKKGDQIAITRVLSAPWIASKGMNALEKNGMPLIWIKPGTEQRWIRRVVDANENLIQIDAPITDEWEQGPTGAVGQIRVLKPGQRPNEIGVESLEFEQDIENGQGRVASRPVIAIGAVEDSWLRDVTISNANNGIDVGPDASRITLADIEFRYPGQQSASSACSGALPSEILVGGSQILVEKSSSHGARHSFHYATSSLAAGPNVVYGLVAKGATCSAIQPHARWATGLLVDSVDIDGAIEFINRGNRGSGHGWAMSWGVIWNSTANRITIQNPPGAANWGGFNHPGNGRVPDKDLHSLLMRQRCLSKRTN